MTVYNLKLANCLFLKFSAHRGWPRVTETMESETVDKGGRLYSPSEPHSAVGGQHVPAQARGAFRQEVLHALPVSQISHISPTFFFIFLD